MWLQMYTFKGDFNHEKKKLFSGVDSTGIDAMFPVTEEEFTKFREALTQKITSFTVCILITNLSFL